MRDLCSDGSFFLPHKAETVRWVCLEDDDLGIRYEPARPEEPLLSLVKRLFPERNVVLEESCRNLLPEAGTRIRLWKTSDGKAVRCEASLLSERYRYLLGKPMNLNRATEADLLLLPGIGPARAARIIEQREHAGEFSTMHDLLHIHGIGRGILKRIQGKATIEP